MVGLCLTVWILVTSYIKYIYIFWSGCSRKGPFDDPLSNLSLRSLSEKSNPLIFMPLLKFLYHSHSLTISSIWTTSSLLDHKTEPLISYVETWRKTQHAFLKHVPKWIWNQITLNNHSATNVIGFSNAFDSSAFYFPNWILKMIFN